MDLQVKIHQPRTADGVQKANALCSEWTTEDDPRRSTGVNDMALLLVLDSEGLFVAEEDGEVVSTLTAVIYDGNYSFFGFYRTKKEVRGKGIGGKLWRAGIAHCGGRSMGLFSTMEMVDIYRRDGFLPYCKIGNYRIKNLSRFKIVQGKEDSKITEIKRTNIQDVLLFDRKYSPAPREKFMEAWTTQPDSEALAYVDCGVVLGYGVVRKTFVPSIRRMGPLLATEVVVAEKLACALLSRVCEAHHVLYDSYNANPSTDSFAKCIDAEWMYGCQAMYRGGVPKFDVTGIYAVTAGAID